MELRTVKYFLAVAEEESVTRGAARMHISQPAVSRQIAALEKELGTELFERSHGRLNLTHAGRRLRSMANDLVRREEMMAAATRAERPTEMTLRIVAQETTVLRTLTPFTAQRGAEHPLVDAVESRPAEVYATVQETGADLGVTTIAPPADWDSRKLCDIGLTAQVCSAHRLYGQSTVEVADLVDYQLILMEEAYVSRTRFDAAVVGVGARVRQPIVMRSAPIAQAHAASGRGVAVLTDAPAHGLHAVHIVLDGEPVTMGLYAGWDPEHYARSVISAWADDFGSWLPTAAENVYAGR